MNAESSEMKYYWGKKMMIQEVKKYEPGTQTSSVYTILIKKKKKKQKRRQGHYETQVLKSSVKEMEGDCDQLK